MTALAFTLAFVTMTIAWALGQRTLHLARAELREARAQLAQARLDLVRERNWRRDDRAADRL